MVSEKLKQEGHEGGQLQLQMIEEAPGFEVGAPISKPGASSISCPSGPVRRSLNASGTLHALHDFMFFRFRLLESVPNIGSSVRRHAGVVSSCPRAGSRR